MLLLRQIFAFRKFLSRLLFKLERNQYDVIRRRARQRRRSVSASRLTSRHHVDSEVRGLRRPRRKLTRRWFSLISFCLQCGLSVARMTSHFLFNVRSERLNATPPGTGV